MLLKNTRPCHNIRINYYTILECFHFLFSNNHSILKQQTHFVSASKIFERALPSNKFNIVGNR